MAALFDTLAYANRLKAVGFTEAQAEVQARELAHVVENEVVNKHDVAEIRRDIEETETSLKRDIKELEASTKRDIKELEASTKRDIEVLRKDMELLRAENKKDIAESKAELIRWVVGVGILQTTMIAALLLKLVR